MTKHMSPAKFAAKVEWEGGVIGALEYGLEAVDLDPDDEASRPLREAWAALEVAYRDHLEPALGDVAEALEAIGGERP